MLKLLERFPLQSILTSIITTATGATISLQTVHFVVGIIAGLIAIITGILGGLVAIKQLRKK